MNDFTCESVARAALGEPVRREGAELLYCCPHSERHANGDIHPSLKVNAKKDTWACFVCAARGTAWALAAFIAHVEASDKPAVSAWLRDRGLLNGASRPKRTKPKKIVATYDYCDATGKLLYQKVRTEPKSFSFRRPDGSGGWIKDLDGVQRVLYRMPDVISAAEILVVEGEKDAETARGLKMCSTTGGSASDPWLPQFTEALRGKDVVVIADADEPGRTKAKTIASSLYGTAATVRLCEMPGAKDLSEWMERGGTREQFLAFVSGLPAWKPEIVDGARLLNQVAAYIRRFVSLSPSQTPVVTLWIAHTHAIDAADATPYLAITSAEKQSGKTRLLEVSELLVRNPWLTGKVTAAVLIRKIAAEGPTLLLDESDAAFAGEKEYAQALRGILNTGHRRGGTASSCVGQGAAITYKDFSTFCPKAIAGIGNLPDTIADRCVPIRLKRAARGEHVERFRRRDVEGEAAGLRGQLEAWLTATVGSLRNARPGLPDSLTDRQQDGAEPLLAIADLAGGEWPAVARQALVELYSEAQAAGESIGVRLLVDIRGIYQKRDVDRLPSTELATALAEIETSPWGEWGKAGKPLTAAKLACQLSRYKIVPHNIRITDKILKGYELEDFRDAFERYLRVPDAPLPLSAHLQSATPLQANTHAGFSDFSKGYTVENVAPPKSEKPSENAPCSGVAQSNPPTGAREGEIGCTTIKSEASEPQHRVAVTCWHCQGEKSCACIACWHAGGPGACVTCEGRGQVWRWVQ
jgi:5S rRNA maturation endonuclease (ribonuclease M5)